MEQDDIAGSGKPAMQSSVFFAYSEKSVGNSIFSNIGVTPSEISNDWPQTGEMDGTLFEQ